MIKDYCFDIIGACEAKAEGHPQEIMQRLGFNITHWIGQPIADCIFVRINNAESIAELPDYISELKEPYLLFEEMETV